MKKKIFFLICEKKNMFPTQYCFKRGCEEKKILAFRKRSQQVRKNKEN